MRRICSFVWNDIRKIQKIGNRKKITISASSDAAKGPLEKESMLHAALLRPGRARVRAASAIA